MPLPINQPPLVSDPAADLEMLRQAIVQPKEENQVIKKLSLHIGNVWARNQQDSKSFRRDMLNTMRRVKGEYEPNKLTSIRAFKGSEAYFRSGENKCRAAESWIKDIYRGVS